LRRTASFDVLSVKIGAYSAYRRVEKPKECGKFRTGGVYISPIWGAKTPVRMSLNFVWW